MTFHASPVDVDVRVRVRATVTAGMRRSQVSQSCPTFQTQLVVNPYIDSPLMLFFNRYMQLRDSHTIEVLWFDLLMITK